MYNLCFYEGLRSLLYLNYGKVKYITIAVRVARNIQTMQLILLCNRRKFHILNVII